MIDSFARRICVCVSVAAFAMSAVRAQDNTAPTDQTSIAKPASDSSADSPTSGHDISGLAIIVKVESAGGDTLFHADGYRIRVKTGTKIDVSGGRKSVADVTPSTWIRFEGVRDGTGVLVAQKAAFFPSGTHKALTVMGPKKPVQAEDYQPVIKDSILDARGQVVSLHTKVRYSDSGGACGWHKVPADRALQERVERVGMSVVPAYQKLLSVDSPARIPFRFYAVTDDKIRTDIVCDKGLILVSKKLVERLQNDDQLAAVLADGIAFNLKRQLVTLTPLELAGVSADVLTLIPALSPAGFIAGETAEAVLYHEAVVKLQRECGRIALQLMEDAGYDPWQAPEAWRLLAPKDVPRDIESLKYTHEGDYQLSILKLQYKAAGSAVISR